MTRRPPAFIRYAILVAAIACLFGAVCARSQKPASPATAPAATGTQQGPTAAPDAGAPGAPDQDFFPATKAPGFLLKGGGSGR
jgi:hypothetical protein